MSEQYWDSIWERRRAEDVSWFQSDPSTSLRMVESVTDASSAVIDVGSGASRLIEALLADGYGDITVLDIAPTALARARDRLGDAADEVTWIVGDVTDIEVGRSFDLWHDRAVLHFLTEERDRMAYRSSVLRCVVPGGHVVLAAFGPLGPESCSGLPVMRHDRASLTGVLGAGFELLEYLEEEHRTPAGAAQQFAYALFRRSGSSLR